MILSKYILFILIVVFIVLLFICLYFLFINRKPCIPKCNNVDCGEKYSDGCGNNCGCPDNQTCVGGKCTKKPCIPKCNNVDCGEKYSDSCGNNCGCPDNQTCVGGKCTKKPCIPKCNNVDCGEKYSDSCGNNCGCPDNQTCVGGKCEQKCIQNYDCPDGQVCNNDQGYSVCQPKLCYPQCKNPASCQKGKCACQTIDDCGEYEGCNKDGFCEGIHKDCIPACKYQCDTTSGECICANSDFDCQDNQTCDYGRCLDKQILFSDGNATFSYYQKISTDVFNIASFSELQAAITNGKFTDYTKIGWCSDGNLYTCSSSGPVKVTSTTTGGVYYIGYFNPEYLCSQQCINNQTCEYGRCVCDETKNQCNIGEKCQYKSCIKTGVNYIIQDGGKDFNFYNILFMTGRGGSMIGSPQIATYDQLNSAILNGGFTDYKKEGWCSDGNLYIGSPSGPVKVTDKTIGGLYLYIDPTLNLYI
jgi:hypothetical protein